MYVMVIVKKYMVLNFIEDKHKLICNIFILISYEYPIAYFYHIVTYECICYIL
jgi:hypothetical protein